MKYIITESQLKIVSEIGLNSGVFENTVTDDFFRYVNSKIGGEKIIKTIKEYFESEVGYNVKKHLNKNELKKYFDSLTYAHADFSGFPEELKNVDVIGNMSFFFAKKFFKIHQGVDILYVKTKGDDYYFFDPELEELVGNISVGSIYESFRELFPKKVKRVIISTVDKMLKGQGYGTKMYRTIIEDVGCLVSDTSLFGESLNIWVNVLPKYYKSGYVTESLDSNDYKLVLMKGKNRFPNPEKVKRYFAIK
jgi:hypothetical protein